MPVDNNSFQKNANTSLVANTIWKEKRISRADIARKLNLYRSTVTNITSFLLENNVVREGFVKESTQLGGRRAVELSINPNFGCVIGFDIQPSHYRIVILQADGNELCSEKGSFGNIPLKQMIEKAVEKALKMHSSYRIPIIALSFSIPGIVDNSYSTVVSSFPFYEKDVNVREIVYSKHNYPVFVENDANTVAWLDGYKNGFAGNLLSVVADFHEEAKTNPNIVGIGTGFGITINGLVYRGSHNAAGEFKTISWKKGLNNQSGLSEEVLKGTIDDSHCLELWVEDTIKSLVPTLAIMDFGSIIFHGNPFSNENWVKNVISQKVPEFVEIVKNTGSKVLFDTSDECVSARGAAIMCLHKFFSVPDLNSETESLNIWDKNIAFLKMQSK